MVAEDVSIVMNTSRSREKSMGALLWLVVYLVSMSVVIMALTRARASALRTYGTGQAQRDWERWREDAAGESGESQPLTGPVQRRKPKSTSPPAMVLMRDHFAICLSFSLIMTSALFVMTMVMVRGVFGRRSR
jgi:hypothetical protein